jgi:RES domain-containing protein
MLAFRVGDRRHKIFDPTGAMLHGGRWNSPGKSVIYAAQTYAGALLEVLVHANLGSVPKNHAVVDIFIPDDLPVETLRDSDLPGWNSQDTTASRRFGDQWLEEARTPVLLVPSLVLQAREQNVLINPVHPDFLRIRAADPEPVVWDARLFPGITPTS